MQDAKRYGAAKLRTGVQERLRVLSAVTEFRAIDLALAAVIALVVIRLIDELAKGGWLGSPGLSTLAGASSCSQSLMRRMPSPYARSQRFKIVFHHFHDELLVARVTPAIAVDAAD